jgi:hypothetical protein
VLGRKVIAGNFNGDLLVGFKGEEEAFVTIVAAIERVTVIHGFNDCTIVRPGGSRR